MDGMTAIFEPCPVCGKKRGRLVVCQNRAGTAGVFFVQCELCGAHTAPVYAKPGESVWRAKEKAVALWGQKLVHERKEVTNA
jgi:hypothetical protein